MEVTDDDERPARQSPRKSRSVVLAAVAATCLVGIASVGLAARGRAPEALDEEAGPSAAHVARFADDSRPDIVLVFMDDVGMNDLWHSTDLPKPTEMSKLVRDGVELTSYYGQSLCSPARATLMTGKFAHKIGFSDQQGGVREVTAYSNFSVPLGHDMLPQGMKRLGYQTHAIGKWNIGHCNVKYMPWQRGFDTFVGYFTDGIGYTDHVSDTANTYTVDGVTRPLYDMWRYEGGLAFNGSEYEGAGLDHARLHVDRDDDDQRQARGHGVHPDEQPDAVRDLRLAPLAGLDVDRREVQISEEEARRADAHEHEVPREERRVPPQQR